MRPYKIFTTLVLAIGALAGQGSFVELDNGTPYDWKLVNHHAYQMKWKPAELITAGSSHEQYLEWTKDLLGDDSAAEATYAIVGSPEPQSFTIQARQRGGRKVQIQFHDSLASLGNPKNSLIDLGWKHDGAVSFVLTGNDSSNYVSSNPPVAWMQATFPTIGSRTLREIAMPESHDAGMSELTHAYLGVPYNTQTQSVHIYKQLVFGARWFDLRPAHRKGHWYAGHFSHTVGKWFGGATGRNIENVVRDINRFTSESPGELIFLDLSHDMDIDRWWAPLRPIMWQKLYRQLAKINDLWVEHPDDLPEDLSSVPLSTFVTPGSKSAVIVILPPGAPLPQESLMRLKERSTAASLDADIVKDKGPPPEGKPVSYIDGVSHIDGVKYTDGIIYIDGHVQGSIINPEEVPPIDTENGWGDYADSHTFKWTSLPASNHNAFPELQNFTSSGHQNITINGTSTSHIVSRKKKKPTPEVLSPVGPWARAFIPASRFPSSGSYSETREAGKLAPDQLAKLASNRGSPSSPILHSVWTLTQKLTDVIDITNRLHSIVYMARYAQHCALRDIWGASKKGVTWPNLIQIDNIDSNAIAGLAVAINSYFPTSSGAPKQRRSWRSKRRAELDARAVESASFVPPVVEIIESVVAPDNDDKEVEQRHKGFWGSILDLFAWKKILNFFQRVHHQSQQSSRDERGAVLEARAVESTSSVNPVLDTIMELETVAPDNGNDGDTDVGSELQQVYIYEKIKGLWKKILDLLPWGRILKLLPHHHSQHSRDVKRAVAESPDTNPEPSPPPPPAPPSPPPPVIAPTPAPAPPSDPHKTSVWEYIGCLKNSFTPKCLSLIGQKEAEEKRKHEKNKAEEKRKKAEKKKEEAEKKAKEEQTKKQGKKEGH
ncbi:PI-PLC X-box domain-containing protein [Lachnellula suecica]|uniref:PI-PLC X-box domain-containing protein n=1 Tax=Lachnellula suecica TaxID=602035 RepID=A0A8T9C176_9HELO|nr:PI-PLC X-box domain-containing protein [Lachnellula suecica]